MGWIASSTEMGVIRFQDLPDEIQKRIVRSFDRGFVPDLDDVLGMTEETLLHWSANRALLKFWVNLSHLRQSPAMDEQT